MFTSKTMINIANSLLCIKESMMSVLDGKEGVIRRIHNRGL